MCGSKAFNSRIIKRFFILFISFLFKCTGNEQEWVKSTAQRDENQFDKNSPRPRSRFLIAVFVFCCFFLSSWEKNVLFFALSRSSTIPCGYAFDGLRNKLSQKILSIELPVIFQCASLIENWTNIFSSLNCSRSVWFGSLSSVNVKYFSCDAPKLNFLLT